MNRFGLKIKKSREEANIQLRKVAAYLDIDQAILSKIERGHRKAKREQVEKLATFFDIDQEELLVDWLADKILREVEKDDLAMKALLVAEEEIEYKIIAANDRAAIAKNIKTVIKKFPQVGRAWISGAFVRANDGHQSDINVFIDVLHNIKLSSFEIEGMREQLQEVTKKKVDVTMLNDLKPDLKERIMNGMQLIYEVG